ncbi:L-serine ammonia-lyase [Erythrobacter sp. AP23]|uniref:L-serine ammonia-lyase n=1 Tax=Erythrobacter sp. AP23 TaxID=499656 RepID=UPI0009FB56A7|nr:L-serine ammonia-lyase [Erythrobacter sp. AP23]
MSKLLQERAGSPAPLSVSDLFTIGIGPSSSHTVGPMRAAKQFAAQVASEGPISTIRAHLYGSLALTGRGHATDRAIILGLSGHECETIDPAIIESAVEAVGDQKRLLIDGRAEVPFDPETDIVFHKETFLDDHPNGLTLQAELASGLFISETYYSIGGGAIRRAGDKVDPVNVAVTYPFESGQDLLDICKANEMSIAQIVLANETAWRDRDDTIALLTRIKAAMFDSIERGCNATGILPGGLKVRRRASAMTKRLMERECAARGDVFEWVSVYALAVNEENAAGGKVVTAPTNGAAGVLPAVLKYLEVFVDSDSNLAIEFLLTASAIGILYKTKASISAAEMGCQGEVGVACSMAAGGLAAALGGTPEQVENAAEIGMEHCLGLTCDPVGGLVQIPCIERNTMGAIKAINAAYLALSGDGAHIVSLDAVIETMRQTGVDMSRQYKETSLGGLAVNVVEC